MGATDSKLAFRKGVFRLFEERSIPVDADDYWTLFWTLPESTDDVFSLVSQSDIRRARDTAKENLETLIDKIICQMDEIIHAPVFPSTQHSTLRLLNCCRVLTRIMPYVFESPECGEWETSFFWTPRSVKRLVPNTSDDQDKQEDKVRQDIEPPRGEVMITLAIRCLFLAGFSLPPSMATLESHVNYVIWETGVGSSTPIGSFRDNDTNRNEALRLLTVLLSKSMYISPGQITTKEDPWLRFIVTKMERKVVLALLCSLLNTSCKYNPLGWGVPYNHVMFTDTREQLVSMCLRTLLVILDYRSPRSVQSLRLEQQFGSSSKQTESGVKQSPIEEKEENNEREDNLDTSDNLFRHYLSKLHRAQDFQFLIDGIYRILSYPMQATSSYFPSPNKHIKCNVEMMMLCWKLLETNTRFRTYLIDTERSLDLVVVLIYHCMENKLNPAQVGFVRMSAFILQTLSSDPIFGSKLDKPFENPSSLPVSIRIPYFNGTYADFLLISIFTLIATSRGSLSTLYPTLVFTITNISPYVKNLSTASSSKLVALFGSISAPGFLLADESNHRLVGYLLKAFNNIIQYRFSDNPSFIYAIVRNHKKFERLRDMTMENALEDIENSRLLKEGAQRSQHIPASPSHSIPPLSPSKEVSGSPFTESGGDVSESEISATTRVSGELGLDQVSDKVRGKRPEHLLSRGTSEGSLSFQGFRQGRSSSVVSTASLMPGAKHGFTPTEEWVQKWHDQLPLKTILATLDYLVPQIEAMCTTQSLTSDQQILDFLRHQSLSGILPQPQPLSMHRFQWNESLVIWFRSMLWGQTYVSSIANHGPWNGTSVKLFQIKQQETPQNEPPPSPTTQ
ncbi:high-temperature-induced dauer-formation protein-domain-containing protein [Phycomyces blakesleeanus]|uniref:High-temperature-induced dauer-formation protein-domain-containing protein n=1 Tax=Phycomyces blakesleeanus TaxID=4837 RepID=A0ABR3B7I7_PHYBL